MAADTRLTVFVSTFNRTTTLTRCLESLKRQSMPHRVVIVDNGSTWKDAQDLLSDLSWEHPVYFMPDINDVPVEDGDWEAHGGHSMQAVQRNVQECMHSEWVRRERPELMAVTDADLDLDGDPDSLNVYAHLSWELNRAVGPHLR